MKPVLIAAQKQPKAAAASARAPMVAPAPGDPDGRYFVGSKPCETCHAGLFDEFQQTVMGRNIKSGKITPQGKMECETCHGPGSGHVNGGGGREKGGIRSFRLTDSRGVDVEDFNGVCLSCHETRRPDLLEGFGPRVARPGLRQLPHRDAQGVAAQSAQDRAGDGHLLPVPQGPQGPGAAQLAHAGAREQDHLRQLPQPARQRRPRSCCKEATVNDTCYTCHADKRGPFLFEHAPVRENCLNCHEPHGSNHESLLIVARQRLCQQCHTPPHNQPGLPAGGLRCAVGNACQNCHTNIHGSNAPSGVRWHR